MSGHESDKAARYIGLLETARLNSNWAEVPELVRKVDKHAPHRRCLTQTALTEVQIAHSDRDRPSTASSTASHGGLLDSTPKLVQLIDSERQYPEDRFQAATCLQHVYFLRKEWHTIVGEIAPDLSQQLAALGRKLSDVTGYTRVCVVKSRYFLGYAQEQQGNTAAARSTYEDAMQFLTNAQQDVAASSEYRLWSGRLIARACSLETQSIPSISTLAQANLALSKYRQWSRFSDFSSGSASGASQSYDISRRQVWAQYYHLLSQVLAAGPVYTESNLEPLTFRDGYMTQDTLTVRRQRQRAELKRVETTYETFLIRETQFPKASETNEEVELWADQAVRNWQIQVGSQWTDSELGEGGKEGVSRSTLDILYRAANKTFHSTPILRHLFNVHAALAEFELAIKAFGSYTEIIDKGKARAGKTGQHEIGLDSDDAVLYTAGDAVNILCRYGSRDQAEKALDIGRTISHWLQQERPKTPGDVAAERHADGAGEKIDGETLTSAPALATAYRAVGQSQANWARYTYEPKQRLEMQASAIKSLRQSARTLQSISDLDTAFLLAYVLAETRDITGAIQVLKSALASVSSTGTESSNDDIIKQRKSIPLWHLLALLLTAKGDFDTASRMCEAAFDQFQEIAKTMDGSKDSAQSTNSNGGSNLTGLSPRILAQLEESEKESLIQIKMTQLSLLGLMESNSAAVSKSRELLALYASLFGDPTTKQKLATSASLATLNQPKSSAGTIKSFRGSILGRPKSVRKSMDEKTFDPPPLPENAAFIAQQQQQSDGQYGSTASGGHDSEKPHKHHHLPHIPHPHFRHHDHAQQSANNGSNNSDARTVQDAPLSQNTANRPDQAFPSLPHNLDHEKQIQPLGHLDQPPTQDVRLPAPHPSSSLTPPPRFPSATQRRQSISLLISVWLFVTSLYQAESLLDDARSAIDEAEKLVANFAADLASEDSSARTFDERSWGSGKAVNRLWADVWAERGNLALLLASPHEAISFFDRALSHYPDHPVAATQLSVLLLDIYEGNLGAEKPESDPLVPITPVTVAPAKGKDLSPADLNRLAARDRAYLLLSSLTKLATGWDCSEAWFVLARYYELSSQIEKSKECLWWVVELEDARGVRGWESCIVGHE